MSNRLKYLLLPIAGALSAFLSFVFASPYVKTLNRPELKPSDPEYHFTFGTVWTNVQHFAFGALLCGSFCLILEAGRRTPRRVLISTILGFFIGGILNSIADSGSDYIGILAMRSSGSMGQLAGFAAWFILVPASLSFTIAFALGPTKQRIGRAIYSTIIAAVFTFIARIVSTVVAAASAVSKLGVNGLGQQESNRWEAALPTFMTEAIVIGIVLGLTTLIADRSARKGSIRLVFGRNEYRDWSLDHHANRIGSGEVEIPIRGFNGVQPVHSCIFRQGSQFVLDSQHAPATVNGYPVSQAVLNHGDAIQIGDAMLVFYAGGVVRDNFRPNYAQPMMQPQSVPPYGMPNQGIPQQGMVVDPAFGHQPQMPVAPSPMAQPGQIMPATAQPAVQEFFLTDLGGKQYPLQPGDNTVGREVGNVICLPSNTTVSRQHAIISVQSDQVVLTDLGSANGTRVNKIPLAGPTVLKTDDEVSFGSAVMTFKVFL